jgi:hypothetical protein
MDRKIIGRSAGPPDDLHLLGRGLRGKHSGDAGGILLDLDETQVLCRRSRPGKVVRLPRAPGLLVGTLGLVCGCSLRTQQGAR